ncbi:alpha/beta hydrolase [Companilactobacillus baiquanensis]|uniref:Alpha/beta hydrolase n=1 Tax=Companilactobacillus baiquanensis TaxID=2486005 RepID=A0ABW1UWD6_9LACO|nr:alpha/beta hydrolase [Companilactobacillus baiquanensis]
MTKRQLKFHDHEFEIDTYWLDSLDDQPKPLAIVFPGGAYKFIAGREAQPIALKFASEGIHAIVFDYPLISEKQAIYPLVLQEIATLLNWVGEQSKVHNIDLNKILLVGFSAGAHVVANYNTLMTNEETKKEIFKDDIKVQPAANIIGYPVIDLTLGWPKEDWAMKISADILYWQAQEHLNNNSKPTFIWQTVTDQTVPVMNSLVYAQKMELLHIPYELHLFASGGHGSSLATYVTQDGNEDNVNFANAKWWELCMNWLKVRDILPKE